MKSPVTAYDGTRSRSDDEWVFGWDPTPGIVSVWASRAGEAILWRREGERITTTRERFRPWLFATSLQDLAHTSVSFDTDSLPGARITYRELEGDEGSFRYLLSSADGRLLERELLRGASQRLQRQVTGINQLERDYYQVGPVEQYLMASGRVYFRGLSYEDLHRLTKFAPAKLITPSPLCNASSVVPISCMTV